MSPGDSGAPARRRLCTGGRAAVAPGRSAEKSGSAGGQRRWQVNHVVGPGGTIRPQRRLGAGRHWRAGRARTRAAACHATRSRGGLSRGLRPGGKGCRRVRPEEAGPEAGVGVWGQVGSSGVPRGWGEGARQRSYGKGGLPRLPGAGESWSAAAAVSWSVRIAAEPGGWRNGFPGGPRAAGGGGRGGGYDGFE